MVWGKEWIPMIIEISIALVLIIILLICVSCGIDKILNHLVILRSEIGVTWGEMHRLRNKIEEMEYNMKSAMQDLKQEATSIEDDIDEFIE
jgi:hypothetical protein